MFKSNTFSGNILIRTIKSSVLLFTLRHYELLRTDTHDDHHTTDDDGDDCCA
jgi:hypothetical protein